MKIGKNMKRFVGRFFDELALVAMVVAVVIVGLAISPLLIPNAEAHPNTIDRGVCDSYDVTLYELKKNGFMPAMAGDAYFSEGRDTVIFVNPQTAMISVIEDRGNGVSCVVEVYENVIMIDMETGNPL